MDITHWDNKCSSPLRSQGLFGTLLLCLLCTFLHLQGKAHCSIPLGECLLRTGAEWEGQASTHAGTVVCDKCSNGGNVRAHRARGGGPLTWTWEV